MAHQALLRILGMLRANMSANSEPFSTQFTASRSDALVYIGPLEKVPTSATHPVVLGHRRRVA
jgi:hypothetical protein